MNNYHTHTTYCDGNSSPREIVEQAVSLGMSELGFSGHSYTSIDESYCMSRDGMRKYYDEIGMLAREYGAISSTPAENYGDPTSAESGGAGTNCAVGAAGCADGGAANGKAPLKIMRGIEMDYFSDPEDYEYDWDYIICSCHYIEKDGNIFPVDESEEILLTACEKYYSGDIYALISDYYNEVGDVIRKIRSGLLAAGIKAAKKTDAGKDISDKADDHFAYDCITAKHSADAKLIIGHFDLITKFNEGGKLFDESDPRYVSAWMSALDRICPEYTAPENKIESSTCCGAVSGSGAATAYDSVIFEINTGAMSRGYRSAPYPTKEILIEIARMGIPVILSSDSHDKSTLLYGFDEASRITAKCGVRVLPTIF